MTLLANSNYVLNVYISNIKVQKQICCIGQNHETCISFKFLEKVEFDICVANDPRLTLSCPCVIKFDKGKTCMFLMTDEMAKKANDINLYMDIYQKMPCACLPSKLNLGNSKFDLSEQFTKVNAGESKPIQQYVPVKDTDGDEIAVVDMMIRVSKLNNVNMNDFTMNNEGNNFMVKGNDDPHSYMFTRATGHKMSPTMGQEIESGCCSDKNHFQSNRSFVGRGGAGGIFDGGWDEGVGGGRGTGGSCCGGSGFTEIGGNQASHPEGGCGCFEGNEIAVVVMMIQVSKLNNINLNYFTMTDEGNYFMVKGNDVPQSYTFKRAGHMMSPSLGQETGVPKKTYDDKFDQIDLNVVGNQIIIKVPKPSFLFFDYPRPVVAAPEVVAPAVVAPIAIAPPIVAPAVIAPAVLTPTVVKPAIVTPAVVAPPVVAPAVVAPAVVKPAVIAPPVTVPAPIVPQAKPEPSPVVPAPVVPAPTVSPPPSPPAAPVSSPENVEEKPYVLRVVKRKSL